MKKILKLDKKPCTLSFTISVSRPQEIIVEVLNPKKQNTYYVNKRYKVAIKDKQIYLRLPQSSEEVEILIYRKGTPAMASDPTFSVSEIKIIELKTNTLISELRRKKTLRFIKFAQWFCENASILSPGSYKEDEFRINYVPDILDRKTGAKMNTPARITANTGNIDIAKNKFVLYTIPQRMAILLHEFSHVYLNDNMKDEWEADRHMARCMLGLGYPYSDILKVFAIVFWGAPTDQNIDRYNKLEKMFDDFQNERYNYITNFYFWET